MGDSAKKMTESVIVELVKSFLLEKVDGNWHEEKVRQAKGHSHGADLVMVGGSHNGERFIIECTDHSIAVINTDRSRTDDLFPFEESLCL